MSPINDNPHCTLKLLGLKRTKKKSWHISFFPSLDKPTLDQRRLHLAEEENKWRSGGRWAAESPSWVEGRSVAPTSSVLRPATWPVQRAALAPLFTRAPPRPMKGPHSSVGECRMCLAFLILGSSGSKLQQGLPRYFPARHSKAPQAAPNSVRRKSQIKPGPETLGRSQHLGGCLLAEV